MSYTSHTNNDINLLRIRSAHLEMIRETRVSIRDGACLYKDIFAQFMATRKKEDLWYPKGKLRGNRAYFIDN